MTDYHRDTFADLQKIEAGDLSPLEVSTQKLLDVAFRSVGLEVMPPINDAVCAVLRHGAQSKDKISS